VHVSVAIISNPHAVTMLWMDYHYITASALPHLSCLADAEPSRGVIFCGLGGEEARFFFLPCCKDRVSFSSMCSFLFAFCPLALTGCCISCACTGTWLMYPIRIRSAYSANHPPHTPPIFFSQCILFLFFFSLPDFLHHSPRLHPHHQRRLWNPFPRPAINARVLLSGA
jgi:hypothetical protein